MLLMLHCNEKASTPSSRNSIQGIYKTDMQELTLQQNTETLTTLASRCSNHAANYGEPAIFDHETGLARILGDKNLFSTMLNVFLETCRTTEEMITDEKGNRDPQTCLQVLHKVKGAAATISADALSLEAASLGKQIKRKNSCTGVNFLEFLSILKNTRQSIINYQQSPS